MCFKMEFAYIGVTLKDVRAKMVKNLKETDVMMAGDA